MSQRAVERGDFPMPAEEIVKHYPVPRVGQPDEIAAACAYFVSEKAGYTTGQVLGINGGTYL